MKNFAKLLICAVVVALVAFTLSAVVFAEEEYVPVDPTTLQPGSDRVIFIADGATGSGASADSPLEAIKDVEGYDPSAEIPKNHLITSFVQATDMLKETGGTIVICGPVVLGTEQAYGSGANTKDVFTAANKTNTIKFTSVYNGVDYRETNNASLTVAGAAEIVLAGQSIWENMKILTDGTERMIGCNGYSTLFGEGIECAPTDELMVDVPQNYISIAGGHRYSKTDGKTFNVTIKSGTYNKIVGSCWGVNATLPTTNGTVNMVLEGTTTVLGEIIGSTRANTTYDGVVNITINGGTYMCDIYGTSKSGFTNTDSTINIVVNGGTFDFQGMYLIAEAPEGFQNNAPAFSTLDLSKAPEEAIQGIVTGLMEGAFTKIVFPDGKTADDYTTEETTTEAPETTPAPATEAKQTTKAAETTKGSKKTVNTDDEKDFPIWIIIVIAAVVVIAAAAVVVFVVILPKKKKAAAAKEEAPKDEENK